MAKHTNETMIRLIMDCMAWPRSRSISWYKTENRWFNSNSPRELVQRGEEQIVVDFLEGHKQARNKPQE